MEDNDLTPEIKKEIFSMYQGGKTAGEIARKLKMEIWRANEAIVECLKCS